MKAQQEYQYCGPYEQVRQALMTGPTHSHTYRQRSTGLETTPCRWMKVDFHSINVSFNFIQWMKVLHAHQGLPSRWQYKSLQEIRSAMSPTIVSQQRALTWSYTKVQPVSPSWTTVPAETRTNPPWYMAVHPGTKLDDGPRRDRGISTSSNGNSPKCYQVRTKLDDGPRGDQDNPLLGSLNEVLHRCHRALPCQCNQTPLLKQH